MKSFFPHTQYIKHLIQIIHMWYMLTEFTWQQSKIPTIFGCCLHLIIVFILFMLFKQELLIFQLKRFPYIDLDEYVGWKRHLLQGNHLAFFSTRMLLLMKISFQHSYYKRTEDDFLKVHFSKQSEILRDKFLKLCCFQLQQST